MVLKTHIGAAMAIANVILIILMTTVQIIALLETPSTGMRIPNIIRQAEKEMPELFHHATKRIHEDGYVVETHKIVTEDGYILTVHRIPPIDSGDKHHTPVLLSHGILGGTDTWIIGGPNISPAYLLADNGYDVWISNARGNFYSRQHQNMTDKNPDFWRFSYHEIGKFDVPAVYDYILKNTGQGSLIYIGHSMGNNVFYVMISLKPKYRSKTKLHIALAPAVFWDNVSSPIARMIRDNIYIIKWILDQQNTYELLPPNAERNAMYYVGCRKNSTLRGLCFQLFSAVVGSAINQSPVKLPMYIARMTESTSGLVMLHLAQNAKSGKFCEFDHGPKINLERYGRTIPSEYDIKLATLPTVLYTSVGDDLVPAQGVSHLSRELPNVLEFHNVTHKSFNHLDYMVHPNVYNLVYRHVLNIMAKY